MPATLGFEFKGNAHPPKYFWLIEIANSTLAKDLGVKRDLSAQAGIPEYWVMNLQTSELVVFKNLTANEYRSALGKLRAKKNKPRENRVVFKW